MMLSAHFSLAEFTASVTALERNIDNTPPASLIPVLQETAQMMERIRYAMGGMPISVSSVFRCLLLNRAIGSKDTSDHPKGCAVDFTCHHYGTPTQIALMLSKRVDELGIGQLILEGVKGKQWVHVSTRKPANPVNRVLTITDAGERPGIIPL